MNPQAITITLSEQTYQRVQKRANQRTRSVADALEQVVEATLSNTTAEEAALSEIDSELEQLAFLDNDQLWQAARLTVPVEKSDKA
ncbi:MAG: hypothetical protein KDE56_34075, partial [Anaerolineales bacterium]|nr:hypothetical protein [Anaerolineales bacterium]